MLIEPKKFIQQVLEKFAQAYLCYVIIIEDCLPQVHQSRITQISSTTAKLISIPKAYKDFEDVFFTKNTSYIPVHKDHDHIINLVDNK